MRLPTPALPLVAALFALVVTSPAAIAQSGTRSDSLRRRGNCQLAARVITTGRPVTKSPWAYGFIYLCPEAGGALASAWSRPLSGEELTDREYESTTVTDARILRAALLVAADARRAMAERRSALEVVAQLCRPGRTLGGVWSRLHDREVLLGVLFDRDTVPGAAPIHDSDREAAIAALERIVGSEPRTDIGLASRLLAVQLKRPPF